MVRTGGRWNRRRPRCHVAETLAIGSGFPHLEAVFSPPAAATVPRHAAHGRRPAESPAQAVRPRRPAVRSEEHTSELQSLMRISYAVFCLKKKTNTKTEE